jgi:hypothetical protein
LFLFQLGNASMLPLAGESLIYQGESRSSLIVSALIVLPQIQANKLGGGRALGGDARARQIQTIVGTAKGQVAGVRVHHRLGQQFSFWRGA